MIIRWWCCRVEANECSASMVAIMRNMYEKVLPSLVDAQRRDNSSSSSSSSSSSRCSSCRGAVEESTTLASPNEDIDQLPSVTSFSSSADSYRHAMWYPYLASPIIDDWDFERRLQPVPLVDKSDINEIITWLASHTAEQNNDGGSISVQVGEFLALYNRRSRANSFEYVVTSFFIDTANDVIPYLTTIRCLLVDGGYWINAGPLHYHNFNIEKSRASNKRVTVPYSYAMIVRIALKLGFRVVHERIIEGSYNGEDEVTMKPDYYKIPLTIFRLQKLINREDTLELSVKSNRTESWSHPNFVLR
jgi:hypothetical protein